MQIFCRLFIASGTIFHFGPIEQADDGGVRLPYGRPVALDVSVGDLHRGVDVVQSLVHGVFVDIESRGPGDGSPAMPGGVERDMRRQIAVPGGPIGAFPQRLVDTLQPLVQRTVERVSVFVLEVEPE